MTSSISLHLMVRNGSKTIRRMLEPLIDSIDELVFADTGSTDDTPRVLTDIANDHNLRVCGLNASPEVYPDNFFVDDESSFLPWSFVMDNKIMRYTGTKIMKDWSKPRNLISDACMCDYVLKMDAEDVMGSIDTLMVVKTFLDSKPEIDFVACPYFVRKSASSVGYTIDPYLYDVEMYTRIWRNKKDIRFREKCHENVDYLRKLDGSNWIMTSDAFCTYDFRDSLLSGNSVAHRNFKVLLYEYDRCKKLGEDPSKHTLLYLADEALSVDPLFSHTVLLQLHRLSISSPLHFFTRTDSAWFYFLRGLAREGMRLEADALEDYANASSFTLFPRARLRIAMLQGKMDFPGWKHRLIDSLHTCNQVLYPFGASALEIQKAVSLVNA